MNDILDQVDYDGRQDQEPLHLDGNKKIMTHDLDNQ